MTKGLQPLRLVGGAKNSTGTTAYRCSNGYGTAMANGDPVMLSNGHVVKAANGDLVLGVAVGFEWIDPTSKKPVYSTSFPASTSSGGFISGDNRPIVYVADNPDQTFAIDARASLAISAANIGAIFALSLAAPNTTFGFSNAVIDATATVDAGMVRVLGLVETPGNVLNVSGNTVEVVLSKHIYNQ